MNSFFENEYSLRAVTALHQIWHNSSYSYLDIKRPDYGLLMPIKGRMEYHFGISTLEAEPFDVIFLSKGSYYDVGFHNPCESLLVNFDILDGELSPKAPIKLFNDNSGALRQSFEELLHLREEKYLFQSEFYRLVYQISTIYKASNKELQLIEKAKRLIDSNPEMTIAEIAERLFVSYSTLSRKFIKAVGMPPVEYRVSSKLERAKNLLVSTEIPIKEIAFSLGFYDVAYFHKMFLHKYGSTPKQYRMKYRILP